MEATGLLHPTCGGRHQYVGENGGRFWRSVTPGLSETQCIEETNDISDAAGDIFGIALLLE